MSQASTITALEYPYGVLCVDSGYLRPCLAGSYLLEADDCVAFIETGINSTVPHLLRLLEVRGWRREQVRYVIVTHVHLDHAGGAGALMQALPEATFLVHPRGARHMLDPSRLEASVRAVYGDDVFDATYGTLIPIDASRTRIMQDGEVVTLGNRELHFMDSPGHARHHFCVWDSLTRGWFAGDSFGISYREFDTDRGAFIFPTTTPIELDPPVLQQTIAKLLQREPDCMYLTHFGRVGELDRLGRELKAGLERMVEIAERHDGQADRFSLIRADLTDWMVSAARDHGVTMSDSRLLDLLENDLDLNTQGLEVWLNRRQKA